MLKEHAGKKALFLIAESSAFKKRISIGWFVFGLSIVFCVLGQIRRVIIKRLLRLVTYKTWHAQYGVNGGSVAFRFRLNADD